MSFIDQVLALARDNAAEWFWRLVAAVVTLAVSWVLMRIGRSALRRLMDRSGSTRTRTLRPLVQGLGTVTIMGTGCVLALEQIGFDLTAIIAGAGVLGLAIGFGAQELVKDIIAGFFLIFDQVIESGDWIDAGEVCGHVEEVGLRMTKIRAFDGKLWFVRNAQIKIVGNANRDWMRAVVVVQMPYEQDVGGGMTVLDAVGRAWAAENADTVLEPPEVQGVLDLRASSVDVRLVAKVEPGTHWEAERELRVRVKRELEREGLEAPLERRVLYLRPGADASPTVPATTEP